jgi:undecaprenyl-diphosphatase
MTWMTLDSRNFRKTIWSFVRAEFVLVASLAVIAAAVLFFIEIADEMTEGEAHGFDMAVLEALHPDPANPSEPVGPRWLDHAAADLTALGSVSVLAATALLAGGFLVLQRKRVEAAIVVVAFAGGLALSESLKALFSRERPPEVYRAAEILNASFPSGHALLSAVVFLTLGAMLAQEAKGMALRIFVMSAAIGLMLIVGATRIYLGVHWTTDVLAGWSVGAAWATACWIVGRWLRNRSAMS